MSESPRPSCVGATPWVACTDLKSTVAHYRDVLGFNGDWHWFWGDPPDHAGVSRGQTRILFVEDADRAARCRGSEVVVYVKGVEALNEELRRSGAQIVRELDERPWGTQDFTVQDPNGFLMIFTEAPDEW